jgi:hypothetical protein
MKEKSNALVHYRERSRGKFPLTRFTPRAPLFYAILRERLIFNGPCAREFVVSFTKPAFGSKFTVQYMQGGLAAPAFFFQIYFRGLIMWIKLHRQSIDNDWLKIINSGLFGHIAF